MAMIGQLRSMMDNLSDVYYLVQLIVRPIFVYLRDLILHKFVWLVATNDEVDYSDSKQRGIATRNITGDVLAFSVLCTVLFLIAMLTSKCDKDEEQPYASAAIETVSSDVQQGTHPYYVPSAASSSTNCFYACGDLIRVPERIPTRSPSDDSLSRVRVVHRKRSKGILKKSIFSLSCAWPQNSQSTQTEKTFHKTSQTWLIRRTRSGHIYGKYRV
ncbi:uncharacterized protein LOC128881494 [Hylaeus volcanicus]|uniref:uncharacterized protein LOC128881494 n=1 Tax=Hylaeus volcanicus TaxID=313075 RepID=UPI0023B84A71|nr:uncharacterized protein LOC128881494 [Hylaeus volcanicus]